MDELHGGYRRVEQRSHAIVLDSEWYVIPSSAINRVPQTGLIRLQTAHACQLLPDPFVLGANSAGSSGSSNVRI